jgi:hypothetical protein
MIHYKDCIWLGTNIGLQHKVMSALHNSPVGGHSGAPTTFQKLRPLFYWPGMRAAILKFIQDCSICAQAKPDRSGYPSLLQLLPVPHESWEVISLDFVEGLPISGSANAVLVVVDKFSKFAHFVPFCHSFTAASVARLFMDHIFKLHRLPVAIISDRDRVFTSRLWRLLFQLAGTELRMSTIYHPLSDGHAEHVNQCMETYLCCFAQAYPHRCSVVVSGGVLVQYELPFGYGQITVRGPLRLSALPFGN